ncbi:rho GTPase-activating protein 7 isoform X1 [Stegastes partitus]|uniref:Rho GTPase-activating protein 7 n=1 Tax=Stegastes partitus TaxID=144197 RepID=A0A3B4Z0Q1_9TELE|nr:PREDICTED: rho GTPase-activating protein 7 isoform X1 [Stegastes partitus]XP_008284490.1 PREDICTED: rho GTPase-activating protein 7 isoform X1 [Stegastes partitus]XP_008284491.1 PREDICTED: rho GTPase-activating protein 7 isoform X1 [Stegastes partitus]XP_008284492.1 PREDICTED: rho GTPase-activating protein 7 isoform X1 [Stegastes partitus]
MPVAIRKRSWEEHVTHPSGLQYSYDDLDLVCCHGVDSEGLWVGSGASKQGRRTRCASMPEGCHQLPTDDPDHTLEGTAFVVKDDMKSEHLKLMENHGKVPPDLQESLHGSHELVGADIPQRPSKSEHLPTTNTENSGEFCCNSNNGMYSANISCATEAITDESDMGTESSQSHNICDDDNVFKRPHVTREERQCISISSDNGPPLLESTGKQPGELPNHQETKESHTEGYSRPPEISEATLSRSSAAELEPQTDLPEVEETKISTSDQAGASSPVGVLHSSANIMEDGNAMLLAIKPVEPIVTSVVDGGCDEGITQSSNAESADKLDGLNEAETLNENTGPKRCSGDIQGGEQDHDDCTGVLDQGQGCEISYQTLMDQQNVEIRAVKRPQGEESAQAESSKKTAHARHEPTESSDICVKSQCCSQTANSNVASEQLNAGYSEENPTQTNNIQCADQHVKMSVGQHMENIDQSLLPIDLTACEDPSVPLQTENSSSKLDTIPEVGLIEADDTSLLDPLQSADVNIIPNPAVQCTHLDDKHEATEQHTQNLPPCSTEVSSELHGNQASGHYFSESPACEVADGHIEHHRLGATASRMEESDERMHSGITSDTQLASSVLDGTNEAGDQKEDNVVKVRMRKREHARLDSMVLLLMKLDQLDQEIENALSATSSMDSTPTLHRRNLLEFDVGSMPAASQPPQHPHVPAALSSGSAPALGAKPKSGNTSAVPEKEKAEIEAKEACTWLRAAGFPQYAQLYEDAQFPIDISSVTRDHDFLDRDAIEALCRRLNTLNKCALMRLEISPQRKRSEDSDEDEPCAISGRWTFQRDSKRWSRMEELEVFSALPTDAVQPPFPKDQVSQKGKLALREGNSSESVLTDLSEQPEVGSIHSSGSGGRGEEKSHGAALINEAVPAGATRASSVASMCSSSGTGGSGCANEDSLSDGLPPSPLETLRQFTFDVKTGMVGLGGSLDRGGGSGKSTRSRAKSFLKRMESLRLRSGTSSKRKKKGNTGGGKIEISGPVIKEGLDDDKLRSLNCVDISSINLNQNLNHHRNPTQTMTLNRNRSVSYSTQTSNGSTGSTGSSQSEASSGSAVSTPSPVTRARSHSTAAGSSKRGGMYLEGFDPFSILQQASDRQPTPPPKSAPPIPCQASNGMTVDEQNRRNNCSVRDNSRQVEEEEEEEEEGMIFFYLPEGHKPGTFPKALRDGSSRNNNGHDNGNSVILRGRQSRRQRRGSSGSVDSRLSFYDNVPYTEREEGEEEEGDERKLQEVLQHVSGLQRFVNAWSEAEAGEEEEEEEDEEEEGDSDSALDSASPCPSSPLQNRLEETENGSDQDSTGNPLGEGEEGMRERRDSGVGASLTRTSRPQKLRWPSFQNSHRPSLASAQLQISCQSVLQMNLLQKLSLLQLTALLEKHTPTNKHGFSWAVPKFMKRIKVRDYKDRNVFGVPLQVIVQRTGQPLPQGIQQAMRYLRNQCLDQVGLFRKSGVKSRIQALRQMNEASGADGGGVNYEGQSAYDVADMLKQYFRDLPEPLLTSKLSETFLQIYQYMPKELRLQAARAAVLLLPDENREALRTLLCLLSDVTASVAENQMTPTNLAVCLAPSVFHLNTLRRKESSSPRVMNRKQTLGKPDQRDLNENLAATHGLAHMIQECRKLFRIPEEMNRCRNSYVEQALLPQRLEELAGEEAGQGGYRAYLQDSLDALLKEAKDKFKGYDSCSTPEHAELSCRKVHDGFPLRLWKVTVEIPASPEEVLARVLREQGHWDEDLLESRVVETLDEKTEVYQYVRNTMAPHPTRDHLVLRTWVTDLPKGACALVCTSVDHEGAPVVGVRANVLTSRYYTEPCGANKSRLTHVSRIDCRGRFPEWYNKLYGHLCAAEVARIRDSFTVTMDK